MNNNDPSAFWRTTNLTWRMVVYSLVWVLREEGRVEHEICAHACTCVRAPARACVFVRSDFVMHYVHLALWTCNFCLEVFYALHINVHSFIHSYQTTLVSNSLKNRDEKTSSSVAVVGNEAFKCTIAISIVILRSGQCAIFLYIIHYSSKRWNNSTNSGISSSWFLKELVEGARFDVKIGYSKKTATLLL